MITIRYRGGGSSRASSGRLHRESATLICPEGAAWYPLGRGRGTRGGSPPWSGTRARSHLSGRDLHPRMPETPRTES